MSYLFAIYESSRRHYNRALSPPSSWFFFSLDGQAKAVVKHYAFSARHGTRLFRTGRTCCLFASLPWRRLFAVQSPSRRLFASGIDLPFSHVASRPLITSRLFASRSITLFLCKSSHIASSQVALPSPLGKSRCLFARKSCRVVSSQSPCLFVRYLEAARGFFEHPLSTLILSSSWCTNVRLFSLSSLKRFLSTRKSKLLRNTMLSPPGTLVCILFYINGDSQTDVLQFTLHPL